MMKFLSKFGNLLSKRKAKPKPKLGNVKLADTKEYLAALALKSINDPSLEDALRMVSLAVYKSIKLIEVSYQYNFKTKEFGISVKSGDTVQCVPDKCIPGIEEVKIIAGMILQIEAEQGRVNEIFAYDMIAANLDLFIEIGESYRKRYESTGGFASVRMCWRYNPKGSVTTKSMLSAHLELRRDGVNTMFHDYRVNLTGIAGVVKTET